MADIGEIMKKLKRQKQEALDALEVYGQQLEEESARRREENERRYEAAEKRCEEGVRQTVEGFYARTVQNYRKTVDRFMNLGLPAASREQTIREHTAFVLRNLQNAPKEIIDQIVDYGSGKIEWLEKEKRGDKNEF